MLRWHGELEMPYFQRPKGALVCGGGGAWVVRNECTPRQ